jgi:transcriptional repressor NrdR
VDLRRTAWWIRGRVKKPIRSGGGASASGARSETKGGRRQKFDRQKVLSGLLRACEKRPVPALKLEQIVDETEAFLVDSPERERTTSEIGELIMDRLKAIDTVAYIRFASVYRDFTDVREFKEELEQLLNSKEHGGRRRVEAPVGKKKP